MSLIHSSALLTRRFLHQCLHRHSVM